MLWNLDKDGDTEFVISGFEPFDRLVDEDSQAMQLGQVAVAKCRCNLGDSPVADIVMPDGNAFAIKWIARALKMEKGRLNKVDVHGWPLVTRLDDRTEEAFQLHRVQFGERAGKSAGKSKLIVDRSQMTARSH